MRASDGGERTTDDGGWPRERPVDGQQARVRAEVASRIRRVAGHLGESDFQQLVDDIVRVKLQFPEGRED